MMRPLTFASIALLVCAAHCATLPRESDGSEPVDFVEKFVQSLSDKEKFEPSEDNDLKAVVKASPYGDKEIHIPVEIVEEPVEILRVPRPDPVKPEETNEVSSVKKVVQTSPYVAEIESSGISQKPADDRDQYQVPPQPPQNPGPIFQGLQNLQNFIAQGVSNVSLAFTNIVRPPPNTVLQDNPAPVPERPNLIVAGLQNLQNGVQQGIQNINQTILSLLIPQRPSQPVNIPNDDVPEKAPPPLTPLQQGFVNITNGFQNGLQNLQSNFQQNVQNINQGFQTFLNPQSSVPNAASDEPRPPPQQQDNIFMTAVQNLQSGFQQGIQNINQTFQNIVNPPPLPLNDDGSVPDPGVVISQGLGAVGQGIQQSIVNIGQNFQGFITRPFQGFQLPQPIQQGVQTIQQGVQNINTGIQTIIRPQAAVVNAAISTPVITSTENYTVEDIVEIDHDQVEQDEVSQNPEEIPLEDAFSDSEIPVVPEPRPDMNLVVDNGRGHKPTVYQSTNVGSSE